MRTSGRRSISISTDRRRRFPARSRQASAASPDRCGNAAASPPRCPRAATERSARRGSLMWPPSGSGRRAAPAAVGRGRSTAAPRPAGLFPIGADQDAHRRRLAGAGGPVTRSPGSGAGSTTASTSSRRALSTRVQQPPGCPRRSPSARRRPVRLRVGADSGHDALRSGFRRILRAQRRSVHRNHSLLAIRPSTILLKSAVPNDNELRTGWHSPATAGPRVRVACSSAVWCFGRACCGSLRIFFGAADGPATGSSTTWLARLQFERARADLLPRQRELLARRKLTICMGHTSGPLSAATSPTETCGSAKWASRPCTRCPTGARLQPSPTAGPLTAATTGCGTGSSL